LHWIVIIAGRDSSFCGALPVVTGSGHRFRWCWSRKRRW
jgi:hypothetical protein